MQGIPHLQRRSPPPAHHSCALLITRPQATPNPSFLSPLFQRRALKGLCSPEEVLLLRCVARRGLGGGDTEAQPLPVTAFPTYRTRVQDLNTSALLSAIVLAGGPAVVAVHHARAPWGVPLHGAQ